MQYKMLPAGFKTVPGFSSVAVSKSGQVLVKRKDGFYHIPNWHLNSSGYKHVTITSDVGQHAPVSVHKLVALAYLTKPEDTTENYVVNHIDGNKFNNHVINLEWCLHRENDRHKIMTFSSSQIRPIIVENIISGQINIIPSLMESSRYFGCAPMTLHERLNKYSGKVWRGMFRVRYATNDEIEKVKGVL